MRSKDPRGRIDDSEAAAAPLATVTGGDADADAAAPAYPMIDEGAGEPAELAGYAVGELLGRGGMGEVLLGYDEEIGREIAIKRMRRLDPGAEAETRFLREAKIQARLQ